MKIVCSNDMARVIGGISWTTKKTDCGGVPCKGKGI